MKVVLSLFVAIGLISATVIAKETKLEIKPSVATTLALIDTQTAPSRDLAPTACAAAGGVCRPVGPHGCKAADQLPYQCNPGVGAVCCRQ